MGETTALASLAQIRDWFDQVPDPEIPAISLVDLGIIRDIAWHGDRLVVTVTPTYSGCPATSVINFEIEAALRGHGIGKLELRRQLSPAWTTAWISARGRRLCAATASRRRSKAAPPAGPANRLSRSSSVRAVVRKTPVWSAGSARRRASRTIAARIASSRSTTSSASERGGPDRVLANERWGQWRGSNVGFRVNSSRKSAYRGTFARRPEETFPSGLVRKAGSTEGRVFPRSGSAGRRRLPWSSAVAPN